MSISTALQPFRQAPKLILSQKFIDDKTAKQLASFLQSHGKVQCLQLKSNDISGQGYAHIFKALLRNPNIKQILIQYNRLGEQGTDEWVQNFSQLINNSARLQRINFSNNKLGRSGFKNIKNAICQSLSLKLVELKYNNIPTDQIASFVQQLKRSGNKTLLYVDLSGNKIQKQTLTELQNYLKNNRERNPVSKDSLMATGGFFNNRQLRANQTVGSVRTNAIDDLSKQNVIRHLQNLLDENRRSTTQIKNKLEQQLAELQRKDKTDTDELLQLDKKCNSLTISNRNLKYEYERAVQEKQQMEKDIQFDAKIREQKILQANKEINDMQMKYEQIQNKMNRQHEAKMKQIARNWEVRLRNVEERIRDVENDENSIQVQIRKIVQRRQKLRVDFEQEESILRNKIQEEENQKYRFKFQALESRLREIEESREKFLVRGKDILYNFQTRQNEGNQDILKYEQDLILLKDKERDFVAKNKNLVVRNEQIKSQIQLKQIKVEKLEQQINRINQQIELRKTFNREQIQKIVVDHQHDRQRKGDQKSNDILKINQLQSSLRNYQLESAKLRQQYIVLEQKLQATLSRAVQQVFSQNNLY